MFCKWCFVVVLILLLFKDNLAESNDASRQKRCIVVQKQSGTHGDSNEAEEDRRPEIKDRKPDRRRGVDYADLKTTDVEELQPELLKYKILPAKQINNMLRFRNQFSRRRPIFGK